MRAKHLAVPPHPRAATLHRSPAIVHNTPVRPVFEPMATRVALHPFLAGLNPTQLALLTDCAIAAEFDAGEVILQESEPANRFYLIESGKVNLEASPAGEKPVIIDTIGAGELLGWSWMFPPYVWRFTARAVQPTRAIFFYGEILRQYCERDHSLGYELLKRMAPVMIKRMQRAREKLLALHSGATALQPVVLESPFMDQELDIPPNIVRGGQFGPGMD